MPSDIDVNDRPQGNRTYYWNSLLFGLRAVHHAIFSLFPHWIFSMQVRELKKVEVLTHPNTSKLLDYNLQKSLVD